MADKKIVSVVMDGAAKRRLEAIVAQHDMKQKAAVGRILTWFTAQEAAVQALVLGHIPDDLVTDIIDLMYRRRHLRSDLTDEDAAGAVRRAAAAAPPRPRRRVQGLERRGTGSAGLGKDSA